MRISIAVSLVFLLPCAPLRAAESAKSLYVVNGLSETLSRVDLRSGAVYEDLVTLGSTPNDIVIRGDRAYVINSGSDDLSVIDLDNDEILSVIDLGEGNNPWSGVLTDDGTMYVTNWSTRSVSRVNLETGAIVRTVEVGAGPEGIATDGERLYVANSGWNGSGYDPGSISVVDLATGSVTETVAVGRNPQDLVIDPQGEIAVVCTGDFGGIAGMLYIVDSARLAVTDSLATGGTPGRASISQAGLVYMAAGGWFGSGEVYLYDALREAPLHLSGDPIRAGLGVMDVATDSEGFMYACSFSENAVSLFDIPDDSVTTYAVGSGPVAIAVREEPWLTFATSADRRFLPQGTELGYSISLSHEGTRQESVTTFSLLLLPGGIPFDGNPFIGPFSLDLDPGDTLTLDLSEVVPPGAPVGRYTLMSVAKDEDSRRQAVGSFWFHVLVGRGKGGY